MKAINYRKELEKDGFLIEKRVFARNNKVTGVSFYVSKYEKTFSFDSLKQAYCLRDMFDIY